MNDVAPGLDIVIPVFNGEKLLPACLDSLLAQEVPGGAVNIYVSDDGSTDGTREVVERYCGEYPNVHHVFREHGGVNAARNAGIEQGSANYVMLIDADEMATPDYAARAIARLEADMSVEGVGGPYRNHRGMLGHRCTRHLPGEAGWVDVEPFVINHLLGGNCVLRRRLFRFGVFDRTLSGLSDEVEFFVRTGASFCFVPDLFVWHRRDHETFHLFAKGVRQGLGEARARELMGDVYRPRWRLFFRATVHGFVQGCARAVENSGRELGSILSWVAWHLVRGRGLATRRRSRRGA